MKLTHLPYILILIMVLSMLTQANTSVQTPYGKNVKNGIQQAINEWLTAGGNLARIGYQKGYGMLTKDKLTVKWVFKSPMNNPFTTLSPVVLDVDFDNKTEIVIVDNAGWLYIIDGRTGYLKHKERLIGENEEYYRGFYKTLAALKLKNKTLLATQISPFSHVYDIVISISKDNITKTYARIKMGEDCKVGNAILSTPVILTYHGKTIVVSIIGLLWGSLKYNEYAYLRVYDYSLGTLKLLLNSRQCCHRGVYYWCVDLPDSSVSVGDVDNDGVPEAVFALDNVRVVDIGAALKGKLVYDFLSPKLVVKEVGGYYVDFYPVLSDVNGDDIPDVIAYGEYNETHGFVVVYDVARGGSEVWKRFVKGYVWRGFASADLNGDGYNDVVATVDPIGDKSKGLVYAFSGRDGRLLWVFEEKVESKYSMAATPSIADIDGDGVLEVLVVSDSGYLYCLDGRSGKVEWNYKLDSGSWTQPVPVDVDGDGVLELLVATLGGYLYCFDSKVSGHPPVAKFTWSPKTPAWGDKVVFDASQSYDPDGRIVKYVWDFGDGEKAEGVKVIHSYSKPGKYVVTLTVYDNDGLYSVCSHEIIVTKRPSVLKVYDAGGVRGTDVEIKAILTDADGAPLKGRKVLFYIGDKFVGGAVTNEYGEATLKIHLTLSKGEYKIKAVFRGDDYYTGSEAYAKLIVVEYRVEVLDLKFEPDEVEPGSTAKAHITLSLSGRFSVDVVMVLHVFEKEYKQSLMLKPGLNIIEFDVSVPNDAKAGAYDATIDLLIAKGVKIYSRSFTNAIKVKRVVNIEILSMNLDKAIVSPGDTVTITLELKNNGNDVVKVCVEASIQGIEGAKIAGKYVMNVNEVKELRLLLTIPPAVKPGVYDVKVVVRDEKGSVLAEHRIPSALRIVSRPGVRLSKSNVYIGSKGLTVTLCLANTAFEKMNYLIELRAEHNGQLLYRKAQLVSFEAGEKKNVTFTFMLSRIPSSGSVDLKVVVYDESMVSVIKEFMVASIPVSEIIRKHVTLNIESTRILLAPGALANLHVSISSTAAISGVRLYVDYDKNVLNVKYVGAAFDLEPEKQVDRWVTLQVKEGVEPGTETVVYIALTDNQGNVLLVKPVTVRIPNVLVTFRTTKVVFKGVGDETRLEVVIQNLEDEPLHDVVLTVELGSGVEITGVEAGQYAGGVATIRLGLVEPGRLVPISVKIKLVSSDVHEVPYKIYVKAKVAPTKSYIIAKTRGTIKVELTSMTPSKPFTSKKTQTQASQATIRIPLQALIYVSAAILVILAIIAIRRVLARRHKSLYF